MNWKEYVGERFSLLDDPSLAARVQFKEDMIGVAIRLDEVIAECAELETRADMASLLDQQTALMDRLEMLAALSGQRKK